MKDESSAMSSSNKVETDATDRTAKGLSSPSAMAARTRLRQPFEGSDQRDDGVSVASSGRRDPEQFADDPAADSLLSTMADSTAVKTTIKGSTMPSNSDSPTMPKDMSTTLRDLADVAGLALHDAPPQGPVDSLSRLPVANNEAAAKASVSAKKADSVATDDVDPDMMKAISRLVASKQAAASGTRPASDTATDVANLTRQIEQMAEKRRTPTARRTMPHRPTPEDGGPLSPRNKSRASQQSAATLVPGQGRPQLDLKHNDNSFHVIADLVLQPFKRGATLSPEAKAQLDTSVPPEMREKFVDALRYRLEHNCPAGSSQRIHVVTRKCQVLGFDKEGSANPLLAAAKVPPQDATPEKTQDEAAVPASTSGDTSKKDTKLSDAEKLARQQLMAELREASNFMAESKTKEASNFWRNHVMELQARLRTLQGDSGAGAGETDEDIMAATRRLLEEASHSEEESTYVPPSVAETDTAVTSSRSNGTGGRSYESGTTGSSGEWAEGGILARGGVMNQLAYLRDLYEMIDVLILLLEIDKLIDFVDAQKIPEKIKDVFSQMDPSKLEDYIRETEFEEYFDPEWIEREFEKFEDQMDMDQFMEDMERNMSPEKYKKMMKQMTKNLLGPEQLRESMNLDKIREMTDPTSLRYYFHKNGLDKVWDVEKLKELMDSKKLREALDANNLRDLLKPQTMRDFMGNSYRGVDPMVDVVAPSNMPGGYRFEAQIDGHRFVATVPPSGVKKGETFSCLMKDIDTMYSGDIPVGGWRDRLTDFLANGVCHPVIWTTLFCPLLTLAQVMTRLKYDFLGRPRSKDASPFAVMSSVIVMWITLNAAIIGAYSFKWSLHLELSVADICALVFVNVAMWVFSIYATSATRASIREKYMIREHRFYDLEDFCCATFAMPFTICQMARHTADYTRHQAACCTETGLEEGADLPNTGSNVSGSNYFCGDAPPTSEFWCADDVTEEKNNRDIV